MFHLQTRVHLEEIEIAVLVDDELDRPGALVIHRLGQRHRLLAHGLARRLVKKGRRRFLHHLLVAALHRTFALAKIDAVAESIGQHLDFDMTRIDDELLDENPLVAERIARLGGRALETVAHFRFVPGNAHALAAAARRGLDHHRIADFSGDPLRMGRVGDDVEKARNRADLGRVGKFLRFDLVAHGDDRLGLRPDEDDALLFQRLAKGGPLGEKPIARMDRFCAGLLAGSDDLVRNEIAFRSGSRTDIASPRQPSPHAPHRDPHPNKPQPWQSPSCAQF